MVNWESSLVELRLDRRPEREGTQREERVDEFGTDSQVVCYINYVYFLSQILVCALRLVI